MRLSMLQIHEGERIPWWGRQWRYDLAGDHIDILPIPLCWLARFVWNVWCWSFKCRPNAWERARQDAWRWGHEAGIDVGMVKSGQMKAFTQECADELWERISSLSNRSAT